LNLVSGHVSGFEVLARWDSPQHGRVSPAVFIPLAERSGILHALLLKLMGEAAVAASWPGQFSLAFNLAPSQFLLPTLVSDLLGTVGGSGFPLSRVVIEITESELFHDNASVQQVLDDLKQHGMALSLDDFGTGYSSLTRLYSLPFDELKIDASFVAALSSDTQSLRIVTAVLGLGQSLGLTVVAEGVESTEQAAVLRKLGCDVGQGFLWSACRRAGLAAVAAMGCRGTPDWTYHRFSACISWRRCIRIHRWACASSIARCALSVPTSCWPTIWAWSWTTFCANRPARYSAMK
jgi:EAL domain-containing protein (putative c-di-GMP-specific phosphodiesterase class I)